MKFCLLSLFSLWIGFGLHAQNVTIVDPESVGISSSRLSSLDQFISNLIENNRIPGVVVLVARKNKIALYKSYGYKDLEKNQPMMKTDIFELKSMTKPVTSVAAMILHENGFFLLDERISRYLTEYKTQLVLNKKSETSSKSVQIDTLDWNKEIKIRNLLTHTSGISYGNRVPEILREQYRSIQNKNYDTLSELIGDLSKLPLICKPGDEWHYGYSTDVLAYLVESVSGKSFSEFLNEKIFAPLNMTDSFFSIPQKYFGRVPSVYKYDSKEKMLIKIDENNSTNKNKLIGGGTGLFSTTLDYYKFCKMLLNYGELDGKRILGKKSVELMIQNHLNSDNEISWLPGYGFGLGFAVRVDLPKSGYLGSVGEYNWTGALSTTFWVDPTEDLIGIFMTQVTPTDHNLLKRIKTLVYQSIVN